MASDPCTKTAKSIGLETGGGKRNRRKCIEPQSTYASYMDEGKVHYCNGHYRKALYCFDRALELKPEDKLALVARSQCHLKLGDADAALKDAETSFTNDGNDEDVYPAGLLQYAEALYSLGLFEKALVAFHRGYRLRKNDDFRVGIQKSADAIRTAIGDKAPTQIEDFFEIIPQIEIIQKLEDMKDEHCCIRVGTNESDTIESLKAKLPPPSEARRQWVAREVLGQMYPDAEYLKRFLKRPDIQSDQGNSEALRNNATEALNYLKIREAFWRQQNPMYVRKYGLNFNNSMVQQYEKQYKEKMEAQWRVKMEASEGAMRKNIEQIEHDLEIRRYKDAQLECDRSLRQMKKINSKFLPHQHEFYAKILHYKGQALMNLKLYEKAVEVFQEEVDVATANKMLEVKISAMDYLAKSYALKRAWADAAEVWEARLVNAKDPNERAYLCHEIGRCYLENNKHNLATMYAEQGLQEAVIAKDCLWQMYLRILMAQVHLKAEELLDASKQFQQAEEHAKSCGKQSQLKLLREGQHCLSIWRDKISKGPPPRGSTVSAGSGGGNEDA